MRRGLEALGAEVDYQRFQLEAAYLTLTFNLVTAAVQEASLRAQIKATQKIIGLQERQLGVVERQFEIGGVSRSTSSRSVPNSPNPGLPPTPPKDARPNPPSNGSPHGQTTR